MRERTSLVSRLAGIDLILNRLDQQDEIARRTLEQAEKTNGTVREHEVRLGMVEQRLEGQEKDGDLTARSKREKRNVLLGVAGTFVVLTIVDRLLPLIHVG